MEKLKRCPFCGKNVTFVGTVAEIIGAEETDTNYLSDSEHYSVVCDYNEGGCGACIGMQYDTHQEARVAWNRRAYDE